MITLRSKDGEIILDYPGGPNVISRVFREAGSESQLRRGEG